MSFALGFFGRASEILEDRAKYIREKRAKDRDYLMTYGTQAVLKTQDTANKAISIGKLLEQKGMPVEDINYIVEESGPQALSLIYEEIKDIPSERLTKTTMDNLIKLPKDYKPTGMSYEDSVRKAFGLFKGSMSDDPAENESRSFWAGTLFDPNAANTALDEEYVSGFTGRDIRRIMGTPSPSLKAAPDVDFTGLPKSYSTTERAFMVKNVESHLITKATGLLTSLSGDFDTMDEKGKENYLALKTAISNEDYGTIMKFMPELKSYILDYDRETRGGLRYNAAFTALPAFRNVFEETAVAAGEGTPDIVGDSSSTYFNVEPVKGYNQAKKDYPDIPEASSLSVYPNQEEAQASGDKYFVIERGGQSYVGVNDTTPVTPPKAPEPAMNSGAPGFRATDDLEAIAQETATPEVAAPSTALSAGQKTREWLSGLIPDMEDVSAVAGLTTAATLEGFAATSDFIVGLVGAEEFEGLSGMTLPQKSEMLRQIAQGQRDKVAEIYAKGWDQYMKEKTGQSAPTEVLEEVKANFDVDMLFDPSMVNQLGMDGEQEDDLASAAMRAPEHIEKLGEQAMDAWRKLTSVVSDYQSVAQGTRKDTKTPYSIEEIKAYAENRLGAREKQAMEDRIRDDARQFLQDEKSFPQPLPRIVIDTLEDDIVEEAKVDVEIMRVVQQLDKKGEMPSRKDIEDLVTTLELNQEIDTSRDELYRGPISGKTLPEKLDDIWNFYTGQESEYNPRAVGTVGFRDLGLRDTTDDVRPPRGKGPEFPPLPAGMDNPESERAFFTRPRNMTVEGMTTRGKNYEPDTMNLPSSAGGDKPDLGEAQFGDMIKRVHGNSKAAKDFNSKISSGKVTAADVTRLIKETGRLPETETSNRLLNALFELRDSLNNR